MTRKDKWLVALALLGGAGYLGYRHVFDIAAAIDRWRNPIAENREIVWSKGPAVAPAGERPPNVILIVADDLGMNDISLYGGGVAGGRCQPPTSIQLPNKASASPTVMPPMPPARHRARL